MGLDHIRQKAVRQGRGDAVGQRQDAVVHLFHDQAVQVQKISGNAKLGDGARAAPENLYAGGEPRNKQTAIGSPGACTKDHFARAMKDGCVERLLQRYPLGGTDPVPLLEPGDKPLCR